MPNNCWNKLLVVGTRQDVSRFRRQARGGVDALPLHYALVTDVLGERRSVKSPNPLDLDRLRPRDEESRQQIEERLGDLYMDPKSNTWDVHVGRTKVDGAFARVEYSFMTAWCEPIGPMAYASQDYSNLAFVLASVAECEFTSTFVRRGKVRRWVMPERTWQKLAEFEVFEDEEGEFLAAFQPRIMAALLTHWDKAVTTTMAGLIADT